MEASLPFNHIEADELQVLLNAVTRNPQSSSVAILRLPDEILECVIANLSQPDVRHILLVCRRFYNVGVCQLYQSPVIYTSEVAKFTRQLQGSGFLSRRVKSLQIESTGSYQISWWECTPIAPLWTKELAVLNRVPNLEVLNISATLHEHFWNDPKALEKLEWTLKQAVQRPGSFLSKLRTCHISLWVKGDLNDYFTALQMEYWDHMQAFRPLWLFITLPCLQQLDLHHVLAAESLAGTHNDDDAVEVVTPPLEHLELLGCELTARWLRNILRIRQAKKLILIDTEGPDGAPGRPGNSYSGPITQRWISAMKPIAGVLESLTIDMRWFPEDGLLDFRGLTRVKYLGIDNLFWTEPPSGNEWNHVRIGALLPPNLEVLSIKVEASDERLAFIHGFLSDAIFQEPSVTPNFHSLTIDFTQFWECENLRKLSCLISGLCVPAGIETVFLRKGHFLARGIVSPEPESTMATEGLGLEYAENGWGASFEYLRTMDYSD